jgi:hypothetical protein
MRVSGFCACRLLIYQGASCFSKVRSLRFYLLNLSRNYDTTDSSIRIFTYLITCSFVFCPNSLQSFLTSMYFCNDWDDVSKKIDLRDHVHLNDTTTERYEKIFIDTFSYEKDSLFRIFCMLIFLFFIFLYDSFIPKLSDFLFLMFITFISLISSIYNVFLCYRVCLWRIVAYTAIFSKINKIINFLPMSKSISKFYFYSSLLFMCFTWCFCCALLIVLKI